MLYKWKLVYFENFIQLYLNCANLEVFFDQTKISSVSHWDILQTTADIIT